MNRKLNKTTFKLIAALIAFSILFVYRWYKTPGNNSGGSFNSTEVQTLINPNTALVYTKHAKCRMTCRDITEEEIREVLREGKINPQKSDQNDKPCASYAIEDKVEDGQNLRIVFGICGSTVKVITCIDLGEKHDCNCN